MNSRLVALLILVGCAVAAVTLTIKAWPPTAGQASRMMRVQEAATQARTSCFPRIHHDTHAFEACVIGLINDDGSDRERQLGRAYFGWVGAMNSARMGMQGAAAAAERFRLRFSALQDSLGINDEDLCSSVPGDCVVRAAQLAALRAAAQAAAPSPATVAETADATEATHKH